MIRIFAPVALHDITHAAVTNQKGTRPRPTTDGGPVMTSVPVVVALHYNGYTFELHPCEFVLASHMNANGDPEKKTTRTEDAGGLPVPLGAEQPARAVFHVRLPRGWRVVHEPDPHDRTSLVPAQSVAGMVENRAEITISPYTQNTSEDPESPEAVSMAATRRANGIPPVSDPGVFAPDPVALSRAMKSAMADKMDCLPDLSAGSTGGRAIRNE